MLTQTQQHSTTDKKVLATSQHAGGPSPFASNDKRATLDHSALKTLLSSTPLAQLDSADRERSRKVTQSGRESINILREVDAQLAPFCASILGAQLDNRTVADPLSSRRLIEHQSAQIMRLLPPLSEITDDESRLTKFQAAARSVTMLARNVAGRQFAMLDILVEKGIVGSIAWRGHDACEVSWGQTVITDCELSCHSTTESSNELQPGLLINRRMETQIESRQREIERSSTLLTHIHRMDEPRRWPFPAPEVGKPTRVQPVVTNLPKNLARLTEVITAPHYEKVTQEQTLARRMESIEDVVEHHFTHHSLNRETLKQTAIGAGILVALPLAAVALLAAAPIIATSALLGLLAQDPAIVIAGRYVVAAWTPEEID